MIYLTPWNEDNRRHYVKTGHVCVMIASYEYHYVIWLGNLSSEIERFNSIERAKKYADKYLIDNEYILLTQEQVEKMSILI
jgi:hypothetical protein